MMWRLGIQRHCTLPAPLLTLLHGILLVLVAAGCSGLTSAMLPLAEGKLTNVFFLLTLDRLEHK